MARGRGTAPTRSARRHGAHALAGFVIGLVAVSTAFLFGGPHPDLGPVMEARQQAATAAALRLVQDPEARPSAEAPRSRAVDQPLAPPSAQPVAFTDESEALFSNRYATRIVVAAAGIDAEVRPVGYVFFNGRLNYDVPRVEAGQYVGTGQPGRPGNAVIGGHVARRGADGVFKALPQVKAGDVVEVYRGDHIYRYSVTEIRIVAADATSVMSPTQDATLTLITCFPDDHYRERLVVVGKLIERV